MNIEVPSQYNFLPRFFKLATVNALSVIMIPLAGAISVAFLGHLSNISYLAGVALATVLFDYLYEGCAFIRSATTAITAQAVGRNDREAMLVAGLQNASIALGLGILILLLQYPLRELGFALLNTTPETKAAGMAYFNSRIWGAPAALVNFVLIGWFLGQEQNGKVLLLTVIGNGANIVQDYLYIVLWDWSSTGAGLSQAISQYLTLFVGLVLVSIKVPLEEVRTLAGQFWNLTAFQTSFNLNRNLLVRSLVIVSTFALFGILSAAMGTDILTENALLLQVVALSVSICSGVGYATSTLSGNFKGQAANHQFGSLLQIAVGTNLAIGLVIGLVALLFPETIFQLFTNHSELIEPIKIYVPWLLCVLGNAGVALILDGYFSGLGEGNTIRNAFLINGLLGFVPLAVLASYFRSNHMLWLALSMFMVTRTLTLGIQIPRTLEVKDELAVVANQLPDLPQPEADTPS